MDFQNTHQDSEITCCVCLSDLPSHMMCTLNPCSHEVTCLNCAVVLKADDCPICRTSIESVTIKTAFDPDGEKSCLSLREIRNWKQQIHDTAMTNVPVVLFVGSSQSGKSELVEDIKQKYATANLAEEESFHSTPYGPDVTFPKSGKPLRLATLSAPWGIKKKPELMMNMKRWDIPLVVICVRSAVKDLYNYKAIIGVNSMESFLKHVLRCNFRVICAVTMDKAEQDTTEMAEIIQRRLTTNLVGDHVIKVHVMRPGEDGAQSLAIVCDKVLSEYVYPPMINKTPPSTPM